MKKQDFLSDVNPDHAFFLNSGQYLNNIKQLSEALESMGDDVFGYHVNSEKNDFYSWIADCVKDEQLAKSIRRVKTLKSMRVKIKDRVDNLLHKKSHQVVVEKKNGCLSVKAVKKADLDLKTESSLSKMSKGSARSNTKKAVSAKTKSLKPKSVSKASSKKTVSTKAAKTKSSRVSSRKKK